MEFNTKRYNEILLHTMKTFIKLCEDHDITYYIAYGSAIGAVRHKGLIPWDDDIDVYMLRKDYERFLALKGSLAGSGYGIVDPTDEGYYLPFAKFMDMNTTIWEVKKWEYVIGVFIDVFPLDEASGGKETCWLWKKSHQTSFLYFNGMGHFTFYDLLRNFFGRHLKETEAVLATALWGRRKHNKYRKRFFELEEKAKKEKGDFYIFYNGTYAMKRELFPKSWFSSTVELPFEDFTVKVCKEYHKYLTQLYGDYMQLPPVEKRVSYHGHYFVDLDRRLTIEEAKESIKRG